MDLGKSEMHMEERKQNQVGIVGAIAVPHPPLIVPAVGRGEEERIRPTIDAYKKAAQWIKGLHPDLIVLTSPHAPLFADGFFIADAPQVHGDLARFRAPAAIVDFPGDASFADAIARAARDAGVIVAKESQLSGGIRGNAPSSDIDHGAFVPLYFLAEAGVEAPIVRIGLSGLSPEDHKRLGEAIADAAIAQGKRVAFVASGDLSHKLTADGPYGFDPAGPLFDKEIGRIFDTGDLDDLFTMDEDMCEDAAECGLRSFQIMTGALDGQSSLNGNAGYSSELLSNEGPFGVGYAVGMFEPAHGADAAPSSNDGIDPYVRLARESVESFVSFGRPCARPSGLPPEMLDDRAGVFVSLHENGALRGCIGTISATKGCIADEVIANGVAACSQDPRFEPVRPEELDCLSYSVDVLGRAEPIDSPELLDPKRYGVIVTKGWRRGLLLPNLDGLDTVERQLMIAKQKAGIGPYDDDVELERFEVVRHERGGEARK